MLRRGGTLFSLRSAQAILGLLVVLLLSRNMSESTLAVALVLQGLTMAFGSIGVMGFDVILVQALGQNADDRKQSGRVYSALLGRFLILWCALIAALLLILAVSGIAPWGRGLGAPVWAILLWLWLVSVQVFQSSALLAAGRQATSVFLMGGFSTFLALAILAARSSAGQELSVDDLAFAFVVGLAANTVLAHCGLYYALGRLAPSFNSAPETDWRRITQSALINAFTMIGTHAPIWILWAVAAASETVAYGLAFRLVLPLMIVIQAARTMVAPIAAKALHDRTLKAEERQLREIATAAAFATIAAGILLLSLQTWIFEDLFQRPQVLDRLTLGFLLLGQIALASFGNGLLILRLADQQRLAIWLAFVTVGFLVFTATGLSILWGARGAAAATGFYWLLAGLAPYLFVRAKLGVSLGAFFGRPKIDSIKQ